MSQRAKIISTKAENAETIFLAHLLIQVLVHNQNPIIGVTKGNTLNSFDLKSYAMTNWGK